MAPVAEEAKPAGVKCGFCDRGCTIYDRRPDACRGFRCVWHVSQDEPRFRMASNLRPDRAGVVLEVNSKGNIIAHCQTPEAWRREPMRSWLLRKIAAGITVTLDSSAGVFLFRSDGTAEELEFLDIDPETNERRYRRKRSFLR